MIEGKVGGLQCHRTYGFEEPAESDATLVLVDAEPLELPPRILEVPCVCLVGLRHRYFVKCRCAGVYFACALRCLYSANYREL